MGTSIRAFEPDDLGAVVELSLRAWTPVFASLQAALGTEIFERLHPDWRADQREAVAQVCCADDVSVWVAEGGGCVIGFAAVRLEADRRMGEIVMVAVDPSHQGKGTGTALMEFAADRMREAGVAVAMVETGGDPGHAPARATYEQVGFTLLPIARYFKAL